LEPDAAILCDFWKISKPMRCAGALKICSILRLGCAYRNSENSAYKSQQHR